MLLTLLQAAGSVASPDKALSPEPAARLFRFLFSAVPQWIQLAGILIGVPIGMIVAWLAWKNRLALVTWFRTRSRGYKVALVSAFAVVSLSGAGTGLVGYHYMMHNNDFCQSCHIMDTAWNRFQVSAHKSLTCHECHRQAIWVSSIELYWWVTERRMAVPAHDKVPTKVCAECHMQGVADSSRKNVMLTAGHVVHMKSDSSALKNVQCTTCHGRDFHKFTPNNATCAQSGCHNDKKVKLGAMSSAGFMHCIVCHSFRNRVADTINVSKASKSMSPTSIQCYGCHEMTDRMKKFDLTSDPHRGGCGTCHNPHKQDEPKDALKSCATAQCHGKPDTLTSFHRGLGTHSLDECSTCHKPHSWKVKGNECLACHKTIYTDRPSLRKSSAPAPLREPPVKHAQAWESTPSTPHGGPSADEPDDSAEEAPVWFEPQAAVPHDSTTFPHSKHKKVACTDCHSTDATHGGVRVTRPDGCRSCHHSTTQQVACATCHQKGPTAARSVAVTMNITARKDPSVQRTLTFEHARHAKMECAKCHDETPNRKPKVTCNACHADHHDPQRDCASCHATARTGHDRSAHEGCTTCHTSSGAAQLTSSRSLCISCHEKQRTHEPTGECSTCHLVSTHPGQPDRSLQARARR